MANAPTPSKPWLHLVCDSDPYVGLPLTGMGMTGYIFQLDNERVVKVAKTYSVDSSSDDMEYINEINRKTLENEINIYKRLGHHAGIIPCLQTSNYGIDAKQGNLEDYVEANPAPREALKSDWIMSAIDTLCYVHSRKVLVDEIALRNFLVTDGQIRLADFGQSWLLPLSTDMDTICENDLTTKIEILHLGWILYSITVWHVHKYYFFDPEHDMQWPDQQQLPSLTNLSCGEIIHKCWSGQYVNMEALREEAHATLVYEEKQLD